MASSEQVSSFSLASVVEDVLKQHNVRLGDALLGSASRKSDENSLRRYEAAMWLRKTIGVVGGKDLPAEPSEEDFQNGLRSGILLCNVLNKVQPGAVPKVVEASVDPVANPDGNALSAFQYFENIRNFLVAVQEIGLPTFDASDLEKGGKSARIVNCVLALKSYSEWKQSGGSGSWRYLVNSKPTTFGMAKQNGRRSEPFVNSIERSNSARERSVDSSFSEQQMDKDLGDDHSEGPNMQGTSNSINELVQAVLLDKKQEEISVIVESMLNKVMEEYERRLAIQSDSLKENTKHASTPATPAFDLGDVEVSGITKDVKDNEDITEEEACRYQDIVVDVDSRDPTEKHLILVGKQQKCIEELKHALLVTKSGVKFLQSKYLEEFTNLGKHLHGLAYAASGYRRVLEENRILYNQVQDLKGNIRVYCRVRPFLPGQANGLSTVENIDEGSITITTPLKYGKEAKKSFTFNKVFDPSATQEEVFSDTQPLIRSVLDGYNICIFAYGQTGSGKTYTMTGPKELTEQSLGVNYRALADLFLLSNQRRDAFRYDISVQMLEIYNEQVRDLLSTEGQNKRYPTQIRNSSQTGINVPDASLIPVSSTSDVICLMNLGHKNRAVGATAMNDRSSRSHSCLTVHVQGRNLMSGATLRGSMHLVDLAGSERVDKSEVTGDRLKEAQHINKSLSALGDVISSLAQKNSHVPYRNSKLTQLLQDSLGGQAKTLMFVHISPEMEALGETISTLKFAERVGTVELGAARVNKDNSEVKELKEKIVSLKAALPRKGGDGGTLHLSRPNTPDLSRRKSLGFSPSHSKLPCFGEFSSTGKPQAEDFRGMEVNSDSASSRRNSLDIQELVSSPSWTSHSFDGKDDDRDHGSDDWVDKVMVIKNEEATNKKNDNNNKKQDVEAYRAHYEAATTDESDEARTSDCSETDLMWQLNVQVNVPRVSGIPNGPTSKAKKSSSKLAKPSETRSMIPSLIPQPTRRLSNGGASNVHRVGGKQNPDGKKKKGHTK